MFDFVSSLKISTRIALVALIPLTGCLALASYIMLIKWDRASDLNQLTQLAQVAPYISTVVHELQRERGISSGFLSSGGDAAFRNRLNTQKKQTDKALQKNNQMLDAFPVHNYGTNFEKKLQDARDALSKLNSNRDQVNALSHTAQSATRYYTATISRLLETVAEIAAISQDGLIQKRATAYASLLKLKERTGQERALGTSGFGQGLFPPQLHQDFVSLIAQQDAFRTILYAYASPGQSSFYKEVMSRSDVQSVLTMRKAGIDAGYNVPVSGVSAAAWFDAISRKINLLKTVEDRFSADLISTAHTQKEEAENFLRNSIFAIVGLLAFAVGVAWFAVRSITTPLATVARSTNIIVNGDFENEVSGVQRKDEIGDMARALEVFRNRGAENERFREQQKEAETRAQEEQRQSLLKMADNLESTVGQLVQSASSASSQLASTAETMSALADETNTQAGDATQATNSATESIELVAAAANELNVSIAEVSRHVERSATLMHESNQSTENANTQMANLSESASRINAIIELIQEIAGQTNLLALNATIEAARAGEAGKGFAIVATEVKDLANQTANATEEISLQVRQVQEETTGAAKAMSGINQKVKEISGITQSLTSAFTEQTAATEEIARNMTDAAQINRGVSENVGSVREAADRTGTAAREVQDAADVLSGISEKIRSEISGFIQSIRAA